MADGPSPENLKQARRIVYGEGYGDLRLVRAVAHALDAAEARIMERELPQRERAVRAERERDRMFAVVEVAREAVQARSGVPTEATLDLKLGRLEQEIAALDAADEERTKRNMLTLRWHHNARPITGEDHPAGAILVDGGTGDDAVLIPYTADDVEALKAILDEAGVRYDLHEDP